MMTHPLVKQLRFTRREFMRGIRGVEEAEATKRFMPMNCISWHVGHLAWQEQQYFLVYGQGQMLYPEISRNFAYGAPASPPSIKEVIDVWKAITRAVDPWLDTLTTETLLKNVVSNGRPLKYTYGNLLLRTIYHYWYHLGENMAIRQNLGHQGLPQFVGNIDEEAPYQPE
jgi:uncharacterized damage-inducible protein DinB